MRPCEQREFMHKHHPKHPTKGMLTIVFTIIIFIILFVTMMIVGCLILFLEQLGIIDLHSSPNVFIPLVGFGIASVAIGTFIATIFSSIPLKPLHIIINGMNQLANGHFHTRIYLGPFAISEDVAKSFNTLAEELEQTEMLRSDFVNNFSHEFKTPIVSICGFAKLLQKNTLSAAQQKEYLSIIVEESTRLSEMATNVLNLTKVENQTILTDQTTFNLSEQLRGCILMLEQKWLKKAIAIKIDFNEVMVYANEELLKQVWINLLENAIKFVKQEGEITLTIHETMTDLEVCIGNNGPEMTPEEIKRIFDKFWQGDTSHATEGTGIGLSIVKRIVNLHEGAIRVTSSPEETVFCVVLPKL